MDERERGQRPQVRREDPGPPAAEQREDHQQRCVADSERGCHQDQERGYADATVELPDPEQGHAERDDEVHQERQLRCQFLVEPTPQQGRDGRARARDARYHGYPLYYPADDGVAERHLLYLLLGPRLGREPQDQAGDGQRYRYRQGCVELLEQAAERQTDDGSGYRAGQHQQTQPPARFGATLRRAEPTGETADG